MFLLLRNFQLISRNGTKTVGINNIINWNCNIIKKSQVKDTQNDQILKYKTTFVGINMMLDPI